MKHKTSVFIRGQVWYWEDPMYGAKQYGCDVALGEQTIRYNRYCIVIQNSDTIINNSVLVIPCSSKNSSPNDVAITLAHPCCINNTYAKVSSVFPVHPKRLTKYVCTLGTDAMDEIDAKLHQIMFSSNDIIDIIDTDDEINVDENYYNSSNDSISNQLSVYNSEDDTNIDFEQDVSSADSDVKEFDKPDVSNINMKKGFRYSKEEMKEFIKIYLSSGRDTVADMYSIKVNTVYACLARFKKALNIKKYEEVLNESTEEEISRTESNQNKITTVPVLTDSPQAVSKVANKIIATLRDEDVFWNTTVSSIAEFTDDDINKEDDINNSETFYERLKCSIYFALTDFLGISINKYNKHYIPNITEKSPHLNTWHFLDKIYHDRRISTEQNGVEMVELYRKYYGDINNGIDSDWIEIVRKKINNRIQILTDEDCDYICNTIKKYYCN
jgi:hypothetical protein